MTQIERAFLAFDNYNKQDPNLFVFDGIAYPKEYIFSLRLHSWITRLYPEAGEDLLLASRCQHIGRWEIPRDSYPAGREAYLKWRKDLAMHHFSIADDLLRQAGYDEELISRVKSILLKQKIKVDANVQAMENALCLVFLELQYEEFRKTLDADKLVNVLWKSLLKMDAYGHSFALDLPYSEPGLAFIQKALAKLK